MDEAVLAALQRWPEVADVYGWLELDLRGRYRLRTGAAEPAAYKTIGNAALNAYIGRNYQPDDRGCWFFQNGPQRVFVRLALTPWVFRLHGLDAPVTHTGRSAGQLKGLVLDNQSTPVLVTDIGPGLVDDRDLDQLQGLLRRVDGSVPDDAAFERWLESPGTEEIRLAWRGECLGVEHVARDRLGRLLGYDASPRPPQHPDAL